MAISQRKNINSRFGIEHWRDQIRKNLKIKMTDGRHIENRFFAISQQPVVQYQ